MRAAIALGSRGLGRTAANPNVGCVLVKDGVALARGWTQPGGRPHAEAVALVAAGAEARGATAYVSLEPCAHAGGRGPSCAHLLIEAGIARVVTAVDDPDPRTSGKGMARLAAAGIDCSSGILIEEARDVMAGFFTRMTLGRPRVTLKLAQSIDGRIAMADGASRWITGEEARRHTHMLRARSDAILVGRGTFEADAPRLDVRIDGLEDRNPERFLLSSGKAPQGWTALASPDAVHALPINDLLVEGGAETASAFLRADLVDRLLLYTAPILLGGGMGLGHLGLESLVQAHGRWRSSATRMLGIDRLDTYERIRS